MHRQPQPIKKVGKRVNSDEKAKGSPSATVGLSADTYENAFSKIRKVTGVSDIKELVERFQAVEDQNFSLFNYVNEVNNEIEIYTEEIAKYQVKMNILKNEGVAIDENRSLQVNNIEKELISSNTKTNLLIEKNQEITSITCDLTKGIEVIVLSLQTIAKERRIDIVDTEEEKSLPGQLASRLRRNEKVRQMIDFPAPLRATGPMECTHETLLHYLALLEQKANDLLTLNFVINSSKKAAQLVEGSEGLIAAGGVAGLLGHGPVAMSGTADVVAPSTG